MGTWDLDLATRELEWSGAARGLFGVAHGPSITYEAFIALLELKEQPAGIKPLDISTTIPPRPAPDTKPLPRVFVIGYPGGRQLTFSFEDNHLLDHEAPPRGTPRRRTGSSAP